jgi:hypothetical protein
MHQSRYQSQLKAAAMQEQKQLKEIQRKAREIVAVGPLVDN